MIVSVSRRTDIPAFYSSWFFNRIKEEFALVRNPMNFNQIRRVTLTPDAVDCIVLWTKNPAPLMQNLDRLDCYNYYFQFTLNSYEKDIETNLPCKGEIIDTFKKLSDRIGPERIVWRYDPVLINEKYTIQYHAENFGKMALMLKRYVEKVNMSFVDIYSKTKRNMKSINAEEISLESKCKIAKYMGGIARENSLAIEACVENVDLSQYGIGCAKCIDGDLIEKIIGRRINAKKDKSQRRGCNCVASVDIGAYHTCCHGCLYCYAVYNLSSSMKNMENHDELSPLLIP